MLVTAKPRGDSDGSIVRYFNDIISTDISIYTYETAQDNLTIRNLSLFNITLNAGTYSNITIAPLTTWENDVSFSEFTIQASGISEIQVTAKEYDNKPVFKKDLAGQISTDLLETINGHTSQLAEKASLSGCYKTNKKMIKKQTVKIVCQGDSVTYGTLNAGRVAKPYPQILQERLQDVYGYSDITVINEGHPGCDSAYGKNSFNSQILAYTPDVAIIMWGINDSNLDIPIEDYVSNLNFLISKCKQNNIEVVICTPTQSFVGVVNSRLQLSLYRKACVKCAISNNVQYIDMWEMNEKIYEKGGVLPNLVGDNTHYADSVVHLLADTICANSFIPCTLVHDDKDLIIPSMSSNVLNNLDVEYGSYRDPINFETGGYINLKKSNPIGYIKCPVFVYGNSMDLYLIQSSKPTFGNIGVLNNGVLVATINGNTEAKNCIGIRKYVCRLTQGLNIITLNASSLADTMEFAIEGFQITKDKNMNLKEANGGVITSNEFLQEITKKIKVTIPPIAPNEWDIKNILFNDKDKIFFLKNNKTLVMEYDHTGDGISGLSWFSNRLYIGTTYNIGYVLRIASGQVTLTYADLPNVAQVNVSNPYNTKCHVRIEHKYDGEIKIYVNGTLVITVTDLKGTSGSLGAFLTTSSSYITMENLNIGYI